MKSNELSLRQAVALGLLHGPAELLPISSSAHTLLIASLAGWEYEDLDPATRKSFEVALHVASALALLIAFRGELAAARGELDMRRAVTLGLALGPAALVGYFCERPIERRFGTVRSAAIALAAAAGAMAAADLCGRDERTITQAGPIDGVLLGIAQATALMPGVSRNGATLTVARARGFHRPDAQRLSWQVGLPVLLGAGTLKAWRLLRADHPGEIQGQLAAGAGMAFISSAVSSKLIAPSRSRSLLPYVLYRLLLAALTVARLRRSR